MENTTLIINLLTMSINKIKINMSLEDYLFINYNLSHKDYLSLLKYIPKDLYLDPSNEYIFLNKKDFIKKYKKIKSN